MTSASAIGTRLDWDSAFFGVAIGQAHAQTSADVEATDLWAEREDIRCVYLLVGADRLDATRAAEKRGFLLTGVRVTCSRVAPQDGVPTPADRGVSIRTAGFSDIPALEQIAATSHRDTRFYADPNFSRASCDRLYETWIRSSCEGRADQVLTAEYGGRSAGYISLHLRADDQGQIGLVAVENGARRVGVGRALVGRALEWFGERRVQRVSVVTQAQNIGALCLYQQAGFSVSQVDLWFHKWR